MDIFFSLVQINAIITINILWVAHSAFLAVYKALFWLPKASSVITFLADTSTSIEALERKGLILANFNTVKSPLVHWIWSWNLNFLKAHTLYYIVWKSLPRPEKNLAVESHKRVVHFGKFVIRETNMELGHLPSSRTKMTEWRLFRQ